MKSSYSNRDPWIKNSTFGGAGGVVGFHHKDFVHDRAGCCCFFFVIWPYLSDSSQKNENHVIYSPSCCSKPVWLSSADHKIRYFEECW